MRNRKVTKVTGQPWKHHQDINRLCTPKSLPSHWMWDLWITQRKEHFYINRDVIEKLRFDYNHYRKLRCLQLNVELHSKLSATPFMLFGVTWYLRLHNVTTSYDTFRCVSTKIK